LSQIAFDRQTDRQTGEQTDKLIARPRLHCIAVQLSLLEVQTHTRELLTVIRTHRDDAASSFKAIFEHAR